MRWSGPVQAGDVCGPFAPPAAVFLHPNQISYYGLERWIAEFPGHVIYETRPLGEAPVVRHDPHARPGA